MNLYQSQLDLTAWPWNNRCLVAFQWFHKNGGHFEFLGSIANTLFEEPLVKIACDFVCMHLLSWSETWNVFVADYLKKNGGHFKF